MSAVGSSVGLPRLVPIPEGGTSIELRHEERCFLCKALCASFVALAIAPLQSTVSHIPYCAPLLAPLTRDH